MCSASCHFVVLIWFSLSCFLIAPREQGTVRLLVVQSFSFVPAFAIHPNESGKLKCPLSCLLQFFTGVAMFTDRLTDWRNDKKTHFVWILFTFEWQDLYRERLKWTYNNIPLFTQFCRTTVTPAGHVCLYYTGNCVSWARTTLTVIKMHPDYKVLICMCNYILLCLRRPESEIRSVRINQGILTCKT